MEACEETGIEPIVLDLSVSEDMAKLESFGVRVQFTPTFLFGCKHYIGAKSTKEEYIDLLNEFKGE